MYYKITLTYRNGFPEVVLNSLKAQFQSLNHCFLVVEYGDSGSNCHIEGVIDRSTIKTSNVTRWLTGLYKKLELELTDYSIRVHKVTHLSGALTYASKELKSAGKVFVLNGWESSWIDQQVKSNLRKIPTSKLKSKGIRVTQNTAGAHIYEYCRANNMTITSKNSMIEVIKHMASHDYLFGSIRPLGVYVDTMTHFGIGQAAADSFEQALFFIP